MRLILFRGRPGTGKTTLSNLLAAHIQVPVLRKDDIYDVITGLSENHDLRNQITFNIIYSMLKSNAQHPSTLILDCPFQFEDDIKSFTAWCLSHHVQLQTILVTCSDEALWAERLTERSKNPAPNQLITKFEDLSKRYKVMQIKPDVGEFLIDTIIQPHQNLNLILRFLNCN